MKNVRETQLKKVIVLGFDEYEAILKEIYGETTVVHISLDGLWYEHDIMDIDDDCVCEALALYFDVSSVTSVHCDDCDYAGIWICYQE